MRKLFNFAMEDDSEDADTSVVEDEGTEVSENTDSAEPTDEADAIGGDDAPAEDAEPKVDLHPDNEPADLSELNVQKLSDASKEEQDEELRKEHEEAAKEGGEALSDMDTLMVAQECLANCLTTSHKGALALSQQVHADYRKKRGMGPMRKLAALESYDQVETVAMAMESIGDTVRTIIAAIVSAIRKAVQWLKTWFKTYFSQTKLVAAALDKAQGVFVDFRKKNGDKLQAYYKESGVDLSSFVQGFPYKGILTINGRQPGERYVGGTSVITDMYGTERSSSADLPTTYSSAFSDIGKLVGTISLIDKYVDKGCLKAFETVEEALSASKYPTEMLTFFSPRAFIPKDSVSCEHAEGVTKVDDSELFCKDGYLGNRAVVIQVADSVAEDKIGNGMMQYAGWKMWLKSSTGFMPNGSMRYLTDEEAGASYKELKKLGQETLGFHKTSDQMTYVLDGLLVVLNKLNAGLAGVDGQGPLGLDQANFEVVKRWQLVKDTIAAAQAISAFSETFLAPTSVYARDVMRAWYEYIKATLETENAYISKAKAAK